MIVSTPITSTFANFSLGIFALGTMICLKPSLAASLILSCPFCTVRISPDKPISAAKQIWSRYLQSGWLRICWSNSRVSIPASIWQRLLRKDLADLLTTIIVCIMSIVRWLLNLFFRPQTQKKRTFFKKEYLINQRMLWLYRR